MASNEVKKKLCCSFTLSKHICGLRLNIQKCQANGKQPRLHLIKLKIKKDIGSTIEMKKKTNM